MDPIRQEERSFMRMVWRVTEMDVVGDMKMKEMVLGEEMYSGG